MSRRMSVSMTIGAVRARAKTVTRRHVDTWKYLKPGDRLTLIEKGMGLPKGAKQVVVAEVEIVDVRVETLRQVTAEEVQAEGLWARAMHERGPLLPYADSDEDACVLWFRRFWAKGHGYGDHLAGPLLGIPCRRIEWRYIEPLGWKPEDYPEGHSPFCLRSCDHPCHDAYDEEMLGLSAGPVPGGEK